MSDPAKKKKSKSKEPKKEVQEYSSEIISNRPPELTKRKFVNQYNNEKYLAHPETTYSNTILNMIFDPKEKRSRYVKAKSPVESKYSSKAKGYDNSKSPSKTSFKNK